MTIFLNAEFLIKCENKWKETGVPASTRILLCAASSACIFITTPLASRPNPLDKIRFHVHWKSLNEMLMDNKWTLSDVCALRRVSNFQTIIDDNGDNNAFNKQWQRPLLEYFEFSFDLIDHFWWPLLLHIRSEESKKRRKEKKARNKLHIFSVNLCVLYVYRKSEWICGTNNETK